MESNKKRRAEVELTKDNPDAFVKHGDHTNAAESQVPQRRVVRIRPSDADPAVSGYSDNTTNQSKRNAFAGINLLAGTGPAATHSFSFGSVVPAAVDSDTSKTTTANKTASFAWSGPQNTPSNTPIISKSTTQTLTDIRPDNNRNNTKVSSMSNTNYGAETRKTHRWMKHCVRESYTKYSKAFLATQPTLLRENLLDWAHRRLVFLNTTNPTSAKSKEAEESNNADGPTVSLPTAPAGIEFRFGQPAATTTTSALSTQPIPFVFAGSKNNNSIGTTNNDHDEASLPDEGDENEPSVRAVAGGDPADKDWDEIAKFPNVIFYCKTAGVFTKFAAGLLHLQQSKNRDKNNQINRRMVLRDKLGIKVLINMKIERGTNYTSTTQKTKKGVSYSQILFMACNREDRGMEQFAIKADPETAKTLLDKLKDLSRPSE